MQPMAEVHILMLPMPLGLPYKCFLFNFVFLGGQVVMAAVGVG